LFDPATSSWLASGPLNESRGLHTATLIGTRLIIRDPYVSLVLALRESG